MQKLIFSKKCISWHLNGSDLVRDMEPRDQISRGVKHRQQYDASAYQCIYIIRINFSKHKPKYCRATKCVQIPKLSKMFPRNHSGHNMEKRSSECFQVKRGLTTRLRNSAIPYMQRLLNEKEKRKREICRQIDDYQPVNNDLYCKSVSLRN